MRNQPKSAYRGREMNRLCVWIDDELTAVNDSSQILGFHIGPPERIGDDCIAIFKTTEGHERRHVRYLKSELMVKNTTYLVDLEKKEGWKY